jgi:hypothetical protein
METLFSSNGNFTKNSKLLEEFAYRKKQSVVPKRSVKITAYQQISEQ